jgi:RHS repeat-associated protein
MNPSEFGSLPSGMYAACHADTAGPYGPDRFSITGYSGYGQGTSVADGTVDGYGTPSRIVQTVSHDASSGESEYLTDAGGNETKYEYDGFSRLVKTIFPSTTTPGDQNASDYEQLTYDAYGRMTARRGRDGQSFSYTYDNLGRVTAVDAPGSQPDISYTYDNFGRALTAGQSGHTLTYTYDALNRLTSEAQGSRTVSYQYDAAGQRTRLTWPDSFYVTYEYNTVGEVTAIKENGGSALASFTYDNLGRRASLTRGNGSATGYAFDGVSRLIDIGLDLSGSSHDVWTDLSYNPASQIVSKTINNTGYNFTLPSAYTDTYADNGLNQYTSAGGATPTYDSRGNTTNDGSKTYTYDYSNRLTSVNSTSVLLSYDSSGRLWGLGGSSVADTEFLYDGVDVIAEYNTGGSVVRRYVHGPGIDEPLVWFEGAGHSGSGSPDRRYLFADERGSIIAVEGGSTTKNTYDEYGVPGSGNAGRFQYTGQMWIAEAGLYHYKARAYSPELGRFLQADPIGYGDGMNMYAYVSADPVNGTDPMGLEDGRDVVVVTGVVDDGGLACGPNNTWDECWAFLQFLNQGVEPNLTFPTEIGGGEGIGYQPPPPPKSLPCSAANQSQRGLKVWLGFTNTPVPGTSHAFVTVTANTGYEYASRGGAWSGPTGGDFPNFVAMSGEYGPSFAEYGKETGWIAVGYLDVSYNEAARYMSDFAATTNAQNGWYLGVAQNSNSYAGALLKGFGFTPPDTGRWTPGYGTHKPVTALQCR